MAMAPPSLPSVRMPAIPAALLPLKSPMTTSASASAAGVSGSGSKGVKQQGGQGQLIGKAQQLLDKADSWVSGVVMRGRGGAGGSGSGQGQGQGDGAKEMLDELWTAR